MTRKALFLCILIALPVLLVVMLPRMATSLPWRLEAASTFVRLLLHPAGSVPTPSAPDVITATDFAVPLPTTTATAYVLHPTTTPGTAPPAFTPSPSPTALPAVVNLPSPQYEAQDWNNCGPATLAMYLHFYGWQGNQFDIADKVKPTRADRNVNIDELAAYVAQNVPGYHIRYRVAGDINLLRSLIANQIPVIVEEGYHLEEPFWFGDDLWAGHYLLLTAYNDYTQTFTAQDSFTTADKTIRYDQLRQNWQSFNYLYMLIYPPQKADIVRTLLVADWDEEDNYINAMQRARREININPNDAIAWFNLGSALTYFQRYGEAASAFDQARQNGLPQRILRYRFAPFMAYFHSGRNEDLLSLTEYALKITPNSEEALLWRAWALYRAGKKDEALANLQKALEVSPDYIDALNAVQFIQAN
ncbi:MAG: tetratricopeptide repeat protein [Anaerolineae bacterium]|nr:tetratricopeptide repeat protein [Anaerolineae bacterium]